MSDKQRDDRIHKMEEMRAMGVDPFGARFDTTGNLKQVVDSFKEDAPPERARAAGRIIANRPHGKAAFMHLRDWSGQLQVYIRKDKVGDEAFDLYNLLDLGDIIGVEGEVQRTRTGEVTIFAESITMLSKALRPLPEKYHGLKDVEIKQRRRYLDLISNDETMQVFVKRTQMTRLMRRWLDDRGFVEVETPMMHHISAGATAKPFITHHNALDMDLYLRIAPELHLKRLVVGGMERIYEINRSFRNEGLSPRHNPEFTMIEIYQAYSDYIGMMDMAEAMISEVAQETLGGLVAQYGEAEISFQTPWPRLRYDGLLREHAGVEFHDEQAVAARARELRLDIKPGMPHEEIVDELFGATVEPKLIQPTFVTHFPAAMCPLAKSDPEDPTMTLRFEVYAAGMELANAYSELNDPIEQRERFKVQAGGDESKIDTDFVTALEHGLPPTGGFGLGIDRLAMILLNRQSIRDVILFPLLRPEGGISD